MTDVGEPCPATVAEAAAALEGMPTPPTVVVAASIGGPPVVSALLSQLPATLGLRVLIVQHMPASFTGRFAERVDGLAALSVREATDGDRLGPDEAVVAPGDSHLEAAAVAGDQLRLRVTDDPPVNSVRPAADVTLESVAEKVSGPRVAVVLTGMGTDGAAGAESLAGAGGTVLVQDPSSTRIAGMPTRAIETGAVDRVVDVSALPTAILEALAE